MFLRLGGWKHVDMAVSLDWRISSVTALPGLFEWLWTLHLPVNLLMFLPNLLLKSPRTITQSWDFACAITDFSCVRVSE